MPRLLPLRAGLVVLILCCVASGGCARSGDEWQPSDRFLHDVTIVDLVAGETRPGQSLVIRDDRILAVREARRMRLPDDARVIGSGGFVMPGLWDMHVHALSDADDALARVLPLFIVNGITGVRDMGSLLPGVTQTRARLAADPTLVAPDLVVAGPLLDGVKLPWYGDLPLVLDEAAAARRELPGLLEQGVDFFKVYDQLGEPAYEEVLALAAENGLAVAGHAPAALGMLGAARAGQSTIEHLSVFALRECVAEPGAWFDRAIGAKFSGDYGNYYRTVAEFFDAVDQERCDEAYGAMARAGTFFTPTLVMELNDRARVDEDSLGFLAPASAGWCEQLLTTIDAADAAVREEAYAAFAAQLERMRGAGVALLAGSDTQNNCLVPGESLHWELQQLVALGLRPLDALRAATVNAAAALGRAEDLARVEPGFRADLLLLGADPLERVENARELRGVMHDGRWYDEQALTTLRGEVEQALRSAAESEPAEPAGAD